MTRRALLVLATAGMAFAGPAAAVVLLWTLVATPLTTTIGQSTVFSLTATNLDPLTELGCLEVDLPGSFVIEDLGTPTASNEDEWTSWQSGNDVIVRSLSGGGRLEVGEAVNFTITVHATTAGTFLWPNHAHRQHDCSQTDLTGVPLSVTVLPVVIATPTPSPKPTPTAAPTFTPRPTPAPTATPRPAPPVDPVTATPTPSPSPTVRPTATPEPSPSDGTAAGPRPGGGGGDSSSAPQTIVTARLASGTGGNAEVGVELMGLLDGDFLWYVPAASVGVPGLLVILWVILQAFGALAWIPAIRRMGEEDTLRGTRSSR